MAKIKKQKEAVTETPVVETPVVQVPTFFTQYTKAEYSELLEKYKEQNPAKYELKEAELLEKLSNLE